MIDTVWRHRMLRATFTASLALLEDQQRMIKAMGRSRGWAGGKSNGARRVIDSKERQEKQ